MPVGQANQRRQRRSQQKQKRCLAIRCRDRGQVGTGVNRYRQAIKFCPINFSRFECGINLRDVDGRNKHIVRNSGQHTVSKKKHCWSDVAGHCQYRFDNGRKQMLFMNHRHNRKENDQERCKGQGLLKRVTDLVLISDAVESRQQHNHQQTDQTHRSQVKRQT